jgi:glutaredoxin 3
MVLTCLTFVLATDKSLHNRKYYMVGIASVCVILTYLESAVGFCLGCYMFNKIAPKLGWEECKECTADSLISKDGVEATVPELQALVGGHDAVVFSKTKCPFCVRAKSALRAEGVGFHVVELDSPEGSKWVPTLMKATGQRTVPYVYLQADFIGGATDLEALVTNGKLKERFVSPV